MMAYSGATAAVYHCYRAPLLLCIISHPSAEQTPLAARWTPAARSSRRNASLGGFISQRILIPPSPHNTTAQVSKYCHSDCVKDSIWNRFHAFPDHCCRLWWGGALLCREG